MYPYVQTSLSETYELNPALPNVPLITKTIVSVLDNYGSPTSVTETTTGGGESFTSTATNIHTNNTAIWLIGRLTDATVTRTAPGTTPDLTRESHLDYDPTTGALT